MACKNSCWVWRDSPGPTLFPQVIWIVKTGDVPSKTVPSLQSYGSVFPVMDRFGMHFDPKAFKVDPKGQRDDRTAHKVLPCKSRTNPKEQNPIQWKAKPT